MPGLYLFSKSHLRSRAVLSGPPWVRPLPYWPLLALVLFAAGVAVGPVSAQTVGAQAPGSQLRPAGRDWVSVGRMDVAGRGFCTVTLVAPDRALTAAHCVMDVQSGRPHPLADLSVRLGYRDDRAVVTRGVREVFMSASVPAGGSGGNRIQQVTDDLAILVLDQPVRPAQISPVALSSGSADEGQVLTVVSYAQNRAEAAALQDDCILIARRADGAIVLDCSVDHGASGAPVMEMRGGEPRIVAVISARAEMQLAGFPNATVALAAPVDSGAGRALLWGLTSRAEGLPGSGTTGVRVRRPGADTSEQGGGARFVRP
jgi:protease YdgD